MLRKVFPFALSREDVNTHGCGSCEAMEGAGERKKLPTLAENLSGPAAASIARSGLMNSESKGQERRKIHAVSVGDEGKFVDREREKSALCISEGKESRKRKTNARDTQIERGFSSPVYNTKASPAFFFIKN
jgi:hypothetical protein